MTKYYLAVDIGASSGRLILGHLENGKMELEEVHRFENGMVKKDGELCWEFDRLFQEIKNGLKKCKEIGKIPVSMGVDTWGVDFVLMDKDDKVLGNTVGYRDHRNEGTYWYPESNFQHCISADGCENKTSGISGTG